MDSTATARVITQRPILAVDEKIGRPLA